MPANILNLPQYRVLRFEGDRYGKVTEVIWCMDEPTIDGQRVNLRVESIAT